MPGECVCGPGCTCKNGDCGCGDDDICKCGPECAMDSCKTRIVLKVDGMSCGGCVGGVEQALLAVAGVVSAKVDFGTKLAVIEGQAKTPELIKAIEATGKSAVGCACKCGPGCKCVAGEGGCAVGACACDPAVCAMSAAASPAAYGTVHLALAAAVGVISGIILAKKAL